MSKRSVAKFVFISDLKEGTYTQSQEQYSPSYVTTRNGVVAARVHIWGAVVRKYVNETGDFAALTIDDNTDTISAVLFKDDIDKLETIFEGDNVWIIGKPRLRNEEIQVVTEIIKKSEDINDMLVAKAKAIKTLIASKENTQENNTEQQPAQESGFIKASGLVVEKTDLSGE